MLRTCYGEAGVMDFGLDSLHYSDNFSSDWTAIYNEAACVEGSGKAGGQGVILIVGKFTWGQIWHFDPDFLERNIFWCTGQLILSKSIKIGATHYQILRLKS